MDMFLGVSNSWKKNENFLKYLNKNEIKSNKIRQNFRKIKISKKNEIFENENFVENNILNAKLIVLRYL